MKGNISGVLKIRLYDMAGKGQMRLEMPVTFARPGEPMQVSKTVNAIKSAGAVNGKINGLTSNGMLVNIDTTIKVSPKLLTSV